MCWTAALVWPDKFAVTGDQMTRIMKALEPSGKWGWYLLLGAIVGIAYLVRFRYWLLFAGLEKDYLSWSMQNYFGGITPAYVSAAQAILSGDWMKIPRTYPPGYSVFIAVFQASGINDLQSFRLFQIGIDSLGCLLVYAICRELKCQRIVAAFSALAYAIVPWWAWGSTIVLADAIIPVLTLIIVALMLRARRTQLARDWLFVGLAASFAALTRTELSVLFLVIAVFAYLGSASTRRLHNTLFTQVGFWAPWLCVAIVNYIAFGRFFTANNAFFYSLFSGLGQIDNPYGYYTNDARAGRDLAALGLIYHTAAAELHWKQIYLDAWRQHPGHVIATILHRLHLILLMVDYPLVPLSNLKRVTHIAPYLLAATVAVMVWKRRFLDLLVVLGPLVVALGSLGLMYVELRYVRYAILSYLFAAAVLTSLAVEWWRTSAAKVTAKSSGTAKVLAISYAPLTIVSLALVAVAGPGLLALDTQARMVIEAKSYSAAALAPDSQHNVKDFKESAHGSSVEHNGDGTVTIVTSAQEKGYQGKARTETAGASLLVVDYQVEMIGGPGWLGVLSGDEKQFYAQRALLPNEVASGHMVVGVKDPSVSLVFTGVDAGSRFHVLNMSARTICSAQTKLTLSHLPSYASWLVFPSMKSRPETEMFNCLQN